ncbi:MAG: AarF/ABC1/UbiB kinase family protein [Proteobacteria bacterium]|nr:AarF/ABC1/UbiB kinase family protein [Pseudomonadota bacterium]NDG26233.1 AarF/ABC1/UbiB kinase family protein [Pseudomonadota bacterium]
MKVISTANQISQAFKNAGRLREILKILVSTGFADFMRRMQLTRFLPESQNEDPTYKNLPLPHRLRIAFEKLGPGFVKLGQLMASRPDLIPEDFVEEFSKLQDQVSTIPFSEIKKVVENELNAPLNALFDSFDEEPLAAASIAQVHSARLKTGEQVAVKIQRPGIDKILHTDISILRGLANLLEKYVPETKPFNPEGLVEEFFHTILFELDFRVEANNIRKIKSQLAHSQKVAIPEVFSKYSTQRLLVLEKFEGIRFSDREAILSKGIDPQSIIETGADAFFQMVMRNGLFHGDLHAGNLFVLPDGRIGIIDFGIVGRLSRKVQDSIISMFIAIMDEDYETLATEYVTLCSPTGDTNIALLQKDLMDTISPYVGLTLGDVNVGKLLLQSTGIAARHNLKVPRELMLLFRAIMTIDGLAKKLDPNFDILQLGNRLAKEVVASRYSKERVTKDLIILARDLQDTLETFPKLLKRFLRKWSQNNFVFEIKNRDAELLPHAILKFTYFWILSCLSLALLTVGILFWQKETEPLFLGFSLWGIICLVSSFYLLGTSLWALRKYKK